MIASSLTAALKAVIAAPWGTRVYDTEVPSFVMPLITIEDLSWAPTVQGDGDSLIPSGTQFGKARRASFQVELYEKTRNSTTESAFYAAMNALSAQIKLTNVTTQHESSGYRVIHTYEVVD